jgi:hypothetical protein
MMILGFQLFPFDNKISKDVLQIAHFLLEDNNSNFNFDTFVFKNKYSECLYDEIPTSSNTSLDEFFGEGLGFDSKRRSKDALLVIGKPLAKIKK